MPSGPEFRIPLKDAQEAHAAHVAGWSLRALARLHYKQWGYASADSARHSLRHVFRELGLPIRHRRVATIQALEIHGHSRGRQIGHPAHDQYLAHVRHLRQLKRSPA